ncbi:MAG: formate--phosphoribosylaminoimidazolecarboxamide ligase [Candidatus Micrarchaeota archaeon]
MIEKEEILRILKKYKRPKIATCCSHSSLQIFHGAKQEGFETYGIVTEKKAKFYSSFPNASPDKMMNVHWFSDIVERSEELVKEEVILIPHGSFVEYLGKKLDDLPVPVFGNRRCLSWERERDKMFEWMKKAGFDTPKIKKSNELDGPCMVKFPGAKGGRGYLVVRNHEEFERKTQNAIKMGFITEDELKDCMIQEFLIGVRFYPHYFHSPLSSNNYTLKKGGLELMSVDRRVESDVDEIYRAMGIGMNEDPAYVVAGNEPLVMRESLLSKIMDMGARAVEAADELFGGMPGPFCIETICDRNLKFKVFELSARIVAGTNLYPTGSQYSPYTFNEEMSTGRRIAREIKVAMKKDKLHEVIY